MRDLSELLELAKRAALAAGAEILKFYPVGLNGGTLVDKNLDLIDGANKQNRTKPCGVQDTRLNIRLKPDNSPLTSADLAANEAILQILAQSELPICSEESLLGPVSVTPERFWLVDPLDGTREFIKQNGEFCVCIALIENFRPILGVIFIPISGELFGAVKGSGVQYEILNTQILGITDELNHQNLADDALITPNDSPKTQNLINDSDDGQTINPNLATLIKTNDEQNLDPNLTVVNRLKSQILTQNKLNFPVQNLKFSPENLAKVRAQTGKDLMFISGKTPTSRRIASALNLHEMRVGSAIKFCLLARGEGEIYYRTHQSSLWDNAAGELIAAEAGARMIDLATLKLPRYDLRELKCHKFIVIGKQFAAKQSSILKLAIKK